MVAWSPIEDSSTVVENGRPRMTLVASVSPFGCPLMLGDILISGPPDPRARVALPTIGEFHIVDDSVVDLSHVAWLAQKVCVIKDDLAVGWAGGPGSYEAAKRIISAMRAYPWGRRMTLDDVQQCLATTQYEDQAVVALVGVFSHEEGFGEFGLNTAKLSLPVFNQCRVIGSGRDSFIQVAQGFDLVDDLCPRQQSYPHAIAATLAASSTFLGQEINHYGGLSQGFGGGFEILLFESNKFAKLNDLLYCFWNISEVSQNGITLSPSTIFIKVNYHQDILVVRRSDFAKQEQMSNDYFIICPMTRAPTSEELQTIQIPDLNSTHDCHFVAVKIDEGYEVLSITNLFSRGAMVRFQRRDDGLVSFSIKGELLKYLTERVVERFCGRAS